VTLNFGGMESRSVVTAWIRRGGLPPRARAGRLAAHRGRVERRGAGEASGRHVVHSLFASTDDWDNQLEGTEPAGPPSSTLRIYLTHFRGQPR
jgi:hypothetical protein